MSSTLLQRSRHTPLFLCIFALTAAVGAQTIDLTAPDGGEAFEVGQTMHILWTAENVSSAVITISIDEGRTFTSITGSAITPDDPSWGDYAWVIPATITTGTGSVSVESNGCLIRISDYEGVVSDMSSSTFTIGDPPAAIEMTPQTLVFTESGSQQVVVGQVALPDLAASEGAAWLDVTIDNAAADSAVVMNTVDITGLPDGKYTAVVTLSGADIPLSYSVTLRLGTPVPSRVAIAPTSQMCAPGATVSFSAETFDQFGASIDASVTWSLPDGGGTIAANGSFTSSGTVGSYPVVATAGASIVDTATVLVQEGLLALFAPDGGELFFPGDTMNVRWSSDAQQVSAVVLEISIDGGLTWHALASESITPSSSAWGHFTWIIPETLHGQPTTSTNCLVRISDYVDLTNEDRSDATFEIRSRAPLIAFSDDALVFSSNDSRQVTVSNAGSGELPDLHVSTGARWLTVSIDNSPIDEAIITVTAGTTDLASGLYKSSVTAEAAGITSKSFLVELRVGEPTPSRVVIGPGVQPCEPGGSVTFSAAIFDQMGDPIAGSVEWTVDQDGGSITSDGVFSSNGTLGMFTVGARLSNNASVSSSATVTVGYDELTLLSPDGGEVYQVGQEIAVEWSGRAERFTGMDLAISANGGKTWHSLSSTGTISPDSPQWGCFRWTIPEAINGESLVSNTCVVRINDYANYEISDYSTEPFTIKAPVVKTIGDEGAELQLDEKVSVSIPPAAVKDEDKGTSVQITQTRTSIAPPAGFQLENSGDVFLCTPHGMSFADSIILSLPYDGDTTEVTILRRSDEGTEHWEVITSYWFDPAKPGVVFFKTTQFSVYAVSYEYEQQAVAEKPVPTRARVAPPRMNIVPTTGGLMVGIRAPGAHRGVVLTLNGRRVARFAGERSVTHRLPLPSGIYVIRVEAGAAIMRSRTVVMGR